MSRQHQLGTASWNSKKGFLLITPSSARPIVGSQGTFGDANSLSLHFPHSRPLGRHRSAPRDDPAPGAV